MTTRHKSQPPRAWQRMLSGRRLDLLDPSPLDVEIGDIAHGLARVARWNGQTSGDYPYSVAQHSVLVEEIVGHLRPRIETRWRLAALLHDAAEYVIGDMISPFKTAIGFDYKAFEHRLEAAINIRFGLPPETPATIAALIKRADKAAAYFEATALAGFEPAEAKQFFGRPKLAPPDMTPLPTGKAEARFKARFAELGVGLWKDDFHHTRENPNFD